MGWMARTPTLEAQGRTEAVLKHNKVLLADSTNWVRPALKRCFDVTFALVVLVAMLPLLVVIATAIKLDSCGPVFYRVRRVGYRGSELMMLKFRKMHHDASGLPLTAKDDDRLTRVGGVLARTRLDELPQLWDVLRGRMSVVGPRPEDPTFVELHPVAYERILNVRPGMTGLAQLAYASEHDILDEQNLLGDYVGRIMPQKIALDTLYSGTYNLRKDLAVIGWTIVAVLLHKPVAVHRATGRMNVRRRLSGGAAAHTSHGTSAQSQLADAA